MLSKNTISLGLTGGIGSGKSYVCSLLAQRGIPIFDTDSEARKEMFENRNIHISLQTLLSASPLLPDGSLNKPLISSYIRGGDEHACQVNEIVHPFVRQRFRRWMEAQHVPIVVMESALLFESHFDDEVTNTVCVTAPLELRLHRVMARDGKSREETLRWMSLQMPEDEKLRKADYVIINNEKEPLMPQVDSLLKALRQGCARV